MINSLGFLWEIEEIHGDFPNFRRILFGCPLFLWEWLQNVFGTWGILSHDSRSCGMNLDISADAFFPSSYWGNDVWQVWDFFLTHSTIIDQRFWSFCILFEKSSTLRMEEPFHHVFSIRFQTMAWNTQDKVVPTILCSVGLKLYFNYGLWYPPVI